MSRCRDCANHRFPTFMRNGKELGYCVAINCPTYTSDGNSCIIFTNKDTVQVKTKLSSRNEIICKVHLKDDF